MWEICVLHSREMQRLLILGLALSLIAAGLAPLSACAFFPSGPAECPQATTESPCNQMHSHSAETQLSRGLDKSCCVISQAPPQELQYNAAKVSLTVTLFVTSNSLAVPPIRPSSARLVAEKPSPPSYQSLLCTFLI